MPGVGVYIAGDTPSDRQLVTLWGWTVCAHVHVLIVHYKNVRGHNLPLRGSEENRFLLSGFDEAQSQGL